MRYADHLTIQWIFTSAAFAMDGIELGFGKIRRNMTKQSGKDSEISICGLIIVLVYSIVHGD